MTLAQPKVSNATPERPRYVLHHELWSAQRACLRSTLRFYAQESSRLRAQARQHNARRRSESLARAEGREAPALDPGLDYKIRRGYEVRREHFGELARLHLLVLAMLRGLPRSRVERTVRPERRTIDPNAIYNLLKEYGGGKMWVNKQEIADWLDPPAPAATTELTAPSQEVACAASACTS